LAKLPRRLALLAGVLAALILMGLAVLHLPPVRSRVLDAGRAYAERQLGVAVRASSLDYNLLTRSIELRDLSVASATADQPFLETDRALVVLGPGIYLGRLTVNRISLSRPRLTLVRYGDGTVNLPAQGRGAREQSPIELGIVTVSALSARLDDRLARRSFTVGPFDLSVDTAATSGRAGAFGPGPFTARAGQIDTSGTIAGRLAFDGARVGIEDLTAETKEGRFVLTGWADVIGERPAISSRMTATLNLPQAARLLRFDASGLAGHLESTAEVAGALTTPSIALTVTSRDAAYAPIGDIRLAARSSFSGSRVVIDSLGIDSATGSVQVMGAIELGDPLPRTTDTPSRLALRWSNLRVDDLVTAFGRSLPIRSGSLASGSGGVDFDVRDLRARAWSRVRAEGTTTFRPENGASSPQGVSLSGGADLKLDQGLWSLRHSIQMRRPEGDIAGEVTGRLLQSAGGLQSTLDGRSRLRVGDIRDMLFLLDSVDVSVPPDLVEGLAGSMLAGADIGGTIERPHAQIDLAVRELRAQLSPHTGALNATLAVDAHGVNVRQLEGSLGSTSLQASGQYSWRGRFDARAELSQGDLSELAGQFGLPVTVNGSARLEGTFVGAGRTGQAVLALSARGLEVEGVPIGSMAANGTLALGDAGVMTVVAVAPGVGARARVEILNRAGYPVSGEITLDHDDLGALIPQRYRQQVGDVSGRLSATAIGSGTLSDPAGIRGRIGLRVLDVTAHGTRLALGAPGSITLAEDRIAVESVDLRIGQHSRARVNGQVGVTALPEPLRVRLDGPLSELIDIASCTAGYAPVPVRGDGTAMLDLTVDGTLDHPRPSGTLLVRSPSVEYGSLAPVTGLTLEATIDPTLITFRTLAGQWQGASIGGHGELPWRVVLGPVQAPSWAQSSRLAGWLQALPAEPALARFTIRADNVTETVLKGFLPPERLQNIQGTAAATVTLEADSLSLERVRGAAMLDRASLTLAGVPLTQNGATELRLDNGRARIEHFEWTAEGNSIQASGVMSLAGAQPSFDVDVSGVLDLRVLGAFVTGAAASGTADVDLTLTGAVDNPAIVGRITVADADLQVDSPRLVASELEGTVRLANDRKVDVSLAGLLNTGSARVEGTLDLSELAAPIGKLQFIGRGVALEYPSGLQTESDIDLELILGGTDSTLSGRVEVLDGTYREALVISRQLLSLSSATGTARTAPPADWTARMRLDIAVATASDVRIDNNYGRLDIGATLRLVGTVAFPGVVGRMQAAEDGEIYLGGNTYRIEQLTIDLPNPRAITPEVHFSAETRIGSLPIGVELRCGAGGQCERKVTSLATGVDDEEAEARLFGTADGMASAGERLARLVSGEALGVAGRAVGLDAVRVEQAADRSDIFEDPTLISGDVNPATRLTLSKRLRSNVEVVFSQNLADEGFTWITNYFGRYGLSGRALLLDDQSWAFEFRHEPPIGAGRARPRPRLPEPRIAAVRIAGTPGFPANEVRRQLRLTEGDRFTFGAWQRDRDRLERFYHGQDFLEARIRARRLPADPAGNPASNEPGKPSDDKVLLEYAITRGPTTRFIIRGATVPDALRDRIVGRWASTLFDAFLERDARAIVREHLYSEGYLNATVTADVALDSSRDVKTLTVDVAPGSAVARRIEVTGNSALPTAQLLDVVSTASALSCWLDPRSVEQLLENHYRSEGFLAADVSVSPPETRNGTSVVTINVIERAPYSVGEIALSGLPGELGQEAFSTFGLSTGERYRPAGVSDGVGRLEAQLRQAAYRQASAAVDTRVDATAARVDITVHVTPGPRSILRDVVVEGADATKPAVAEAIVLTPDAPLDPAAIGETRRRLYDLDVYRSVDIEVQPLASAVPPAASGPPTEQPVVARVALEERPRFRLRYGLAINGEEEEPDDRDWRLGFAADVENRNIFGRGATAGLSLRLRSDQQVGRATLGANRLFGLPIRSMLFVEREREQLNPEGAFPITADITSLTAEQTYRFRRAIEWRYGYGIERNHTFIRSQESDPFDLTVTIARLTTSGLVDRRNDAFNPARGWFVSSALELSTPGLGSDLRFLKDFTQYSQFVPVGRGLVLASGVRLGLARTFDDEVLIPSERFFAGGATSVRGYREDDLGARSVFGDAEGGSALLVLNGELRFPVYRWLKGVGFVDVGNVYPTVSDVSLGDLQIGVGTGVRFDTAIGLIRLDFGVPVNRRSFDPRWRIHFGFGHTF
jgi:outer membrane protein assembly complex protein YaeT